MKNVLPFRIRDLGRPALPSRRTPATVIILPVIRLERIVPKKPKSRKARMSTIKNILRVALLFAAALTLDWCVMPAHAQNGLRQVPLGFCSLSSIATSTGLASCSGGIPAGTSYAVICAYAQGIVWRDDGSAATATPGTGGQGLAANQCLPYNGTFTAIRFIQQTSGAILGVSFYR